MRENKTYLFLEVIDKSKIYIIPASYDKDHNTYIPPMVMPIIEQNKKRKECYEKRSRLHYKIIHQKEVD